jgi:ABC-2 type transport system permease protein
MIRIVTMLTLRQLLGRSRTMLMGVAAALPVILALVYRLGSQDADPQEWVARVILEGLIVTTLLPLVALVFGTAALGAEIDDGTAIYLLSKPVPRSRIIAGKLLAAWIATAGLVVVSALGAGAIGLAGGPGDGLLLGFALALALGSLVYCAFFVLLSVATSRALIAGLVYVFIWEGLVNGLFAGTRLLSVRHYTLAVADVFADAPARIFEAKLSPAPAFILMGVFGAASVWYAIRRLERFEIGERT